MLQAAANTVSGAPCRVKRKMLLDSMLTRLLVILLLSILPLSVLFKNAFTVSVGKYERDIGVDDRQNWKMYFMNST
jgi:hypothetical protein